MSLTARAGNLLLASLLAAIPFLTRCAPAEKPLRPILLISIDTLRADHLPAYGYRAIQTPHLDRLARDGVTYDEAWAHVPLTLPSHATLFTGMLPPEHGVRDNAGYTLDARTPTLASQLRNMGYATGGVVSAYVLRATTGIAGGFDDYDDKIPFVEGAPTGNLARDGRETLAIAKRWLEQHTTQPFFLFVHLFEPHAPYEPSYDGEIVKSDALVGELLADLDRRNLYDDTMIVVLSDHGEGLMDHGEQEHGVLLYREALRVPLIVKYPRGEDRGTRIKEPFALADVKALILGTPSKSPLYAETLYPRIHLGWSELRSFVRGSHHLISGPKPELYDFARDPKETQNLRDVERRVYASLSRDLAAVPQPPPTAPRVDPEEAKKLAALGYVSAQQPAAKSDLNPRDHLGDLAELKTVTEQMQRGDFASAANRMEALLQRNPGWSDLRDQLGVAYEAMGNLPAAERAYRDAIRHTPELAGTFALSLASVLLEQRKFADAEAHARLAIATNPQAAHELLGHIYLAQGQFDAAFAEAQRAGNTLSAAFLIARIHAAKNDLRSAVLTLQAMHNESRVERIQLPPDYYFFTGEIFTRLGKTDEARLAYEQQLEVTPNHPGARARLR